MKVFGWKDLSLTTKSHKLWIQLSSYDWVNDSQERRTAEKDLDDKGNKIPIKVYPGCLLYLSGNTCTYSGCLVENATYQ